MKKLALFCSVLCIVVLSGILYVNIGKNNIENKMWAYLEQKHCTETDIQSMEIKHSFVNIFLSYNEWIILVVYKDEPTSIYIFTFKNGEIVQSGVTGTTDKEQLKHRY